jgi:glycosyltransferase involved in cell wall biosynthesis
MVIATSEVTADLLAARFEVPRKRIEVVAPGTDRMPFSVGSNGGPLRLISVGAVVPRKGFDLLVEALASLTDLPWQLAVVGDRERDPAAAAHLDALIARHRLEDRIECLGAVSSERLAALYADADLFVLASHFEGYGMAFAEAIAHGLPVVGTTGGAIAETVPASAGRLVPPGDVAALGNALREVIVDDSCRHALVAGARAAAAALPSWPEAGARFARALEDLA